VFTDVKKICNIRSVFDQYINILKSPKRGQICVSQCRKCFGGQGSAKLKALSPTPYRPNDASASCHAWPSVYLFGCPLFIKILDLPLLANSTFSFKAWRLVLSNFSQVSDILSAFFSLLNLRYSVLYVYFSKKKSKNGSFLLNILTL